MRWLQIREGLENDNSADIQFEGSCILRVRDFIMLLPPLNRAPPSSQFIRLQVSSLSCWFLHQDDTHGGGWRSVLIMRTRHDNSLSVVSCPSSYHLFCRQYLLAFYFLPLSPCLSLGPSQTSISQTQPSLPPWPGLGSNPRLILMSIIFQWY